MDTWKRNAFNRNAVHSAARSGDQPGAICHALPAAPPSPQVGSRRRLPFGEGRPRRLYRDSTIAGTPCPLALIAMSRRSSGEGCLSSASRRARRFRSLDCDWPVRALRARRSGRARLPHDVRCRSEDPTTVVVCGRSQQRYRIDPVVLAATRNAEAPPPRPRLDATTAEGCTGPNCGGGVIPLVGMALTAAKAAVLASEGEDWRDAFRTHPDAYQVYEDAKARTSRISIGLTVANRRP